MYMNMRVSVLESFSVCGAELCGRTAHVVISVAS